MTLILGVAAISFFILRIAALGQEWRYYRSRRDIAISLQDQLDFDRVVLVYYAGVRYFTDMLQSTFSATKVG